MTLYQFIVIYKSIFLLYNNEIFAYRLPLDPPRLHGADRSLVLSPGRRADQHYQELSQEGHLVNENKEICLPYNQMSFLQLEFVQHCLSVVKWVWSFTDCVLVTLNVNDDKMRIYKRSSPCMLIHCIPDISLSMQIYD